MEPDRGAEFRDGLHNPSGHAKRGTEAVVRIGKLGIEVEGNSIFGNCFGMLAVDKKRVAEIVVRARMPWIVSDGSAELARCFFNLSVFTSAHPKLLCASA